MAQQELSVAQPGLKRTQQELEEANSTVKQLTDCLSEKEEYVDSEAHRPNQEELHKVTVYCLRGEKIHP